MTYARYSGFAGSGGGGGGVTSLNGETGAINITAGPGIVVTPSGQTIEISATGTSSNGILATATLYDPVDTSLPSSAPLIIDGVTVTTGMLVLFSNLGSGNNEIYQATVSGGSVTWVVQPVFDNLDSPTAGSLVTIQQGTAFANQLGEFNGTTWLFNYYVRYFNGTNYYEQSSLNTSTLADATSGGTVFSVAYAGSQNILVNYSIIRGTSKEIGTLPITTNGTTAAISSVGSDIPTVGVTFSAVISGSNLVLEYTTTSTGTAATMQYYIVRWSDTAGGPGGPPSYSGGSAPLPAPGASNQVLINESGVISSSPNFTFNPATGFMQVGGAQFSSLVTTTFLDNQSSPVAFATLPAVYNSLNITTTVIRGANIMTQTTLVATDSATALNTAEDFSEVGTTGVVLSVALTGGNIVMSYTSTSTGSGGTIKYQFYGW